ncbi:oligosaccharide flippase family protein, partial [Photobacterium sanctipauli]
DINSAWTLQILFKIVVSLSIFYSSYIAPDFFNEPKIDLVLKVLAIVPLLSGLTNIDLIIQKRNLEFEYIAKSLSYSKLLSFVVTILVA